MAGLDGLRAALAHDYLLVARGAERAFGAIACAFPGAQVYTLLADPEVTATLVPGHPVTTSVLGRLPISQAGFHRLLPVLAPATRSLRPTGVDVLVSSSSAFAHGIRPEPGVPHVSYCHSPFRYVWHETERARERTPRPLRPLMDPTLGAIRRWDVAASRRVDRYVANSRITQQRIQDFWGREAEVVHPPVDVERFTPAEPEDYLLLVCELVSHKRADLALEAARRAGRHTVVVGGGVELERLRVTYGDTATFLGRIGDDQLDDVYARALAFVVPNVEEFGIAAVEAQAAGRPVLAPAAGGTAETVLDGQTGVLVPPGDVGALAEAMRETDFTRFDPAAVRRHALSFGPDRFRRELLAEVAHVTGAPASPVR